MAAEFVGSFIKAFVLLFAIMDPFAGVPIFIALTEKLSRIGRNKAANQAVLLAGIVALSFVFFGTLLLDALRIRISDFQIAGGIVLGIMGLQILFGFERERHKPQDYHVAAVVIGVPLITGPGVITTATVLSASEGVWVTALATVASLLATWLVIRESFWLHKIFGPQVIDAFSRVMGLILVAVAVSFIRAGLGGG